MCGKIKRLELYILGVRGIRGNGRERKKIPKCLKKVRKEVLFLGQEAHKIKLKSN